MTAVIESYIVIDEKRVAWIADTRVKAVYSSFQLDESFLQKPARSEGAQSFRPYFVRASASVTRN